jgi:L-ribulose-5-phosphate 4-epimerase
MLEELRRQVAEVAFTMWKEGLTEGAEGNVSGRDIETGYVAITPSQIPYADMTADDIVVVTDKGEKVWGDHKASTECPMHTYLYRHREDLGAVMHTHSEYAIAASISRCSIPVITFDIALNIGSEIVAVEFAQPGSEERGKKPHEAMLKADARAALLANHGTLVLGKTVWAALDGARALEKGARMYMLACAFGKPKPLPPDTVEHFYQFWQEYKYGAK